MLKLLSVGNYCLSKHLGQWLCEQTHFVERILGVDAGNRLGLILFCFICVIGTNIPDNPRTQDLPPLASQALGVWSPPLIPDRLILLFCVVFRISWPETLYIDQVDLEITEILGLKTHLCSYSIFVSLFFFLSLCVYKDKWGAEGDTGCPALSLSAFYS